MDGISLLVVNKKAITTKQLSMTMGLDTKKLKNNSKNL